MDLTDLLQQCRVYTADQSTFELLPSKQPAVYAFYESFRFREDHLVDDIVTYKTKHARTVSLNTDNLPEHVNIKMRGNPDAFRGEGLTLCNKLDPARRPGICRSLMFLSLLNEPLYVGKTGDIKIRFRGHHDTGFLFKMKDQFKRPPDEFLLFAFYCEDDESRLLESILIQLINPSHCEQKS